MFSSFSRTYAPFHDLGPGTKVCNWRSREDQSLVFKKENDRTWIDVSNPRESATEFDLSCSVAMLEREMR